MATTAPSVEMRVRVDRFEKSRGIVRPARDVLRGHAGCSEGEDWDCSVFQCAEALSIRVLSSVGVRSLIERKWRGLVVPREPGLSVDNERLAVGPAATARIARLRGLDDSFEVMVSLLKSERAHRELSGGVLHDSVV